MGLKINKRKMTKGVKILIDAKTDDGQSIKGYGYIINRFNAHFYEVVLENNQQTYIIHKKDFVEINEE